ncbi:hypothetical protein [Sphaerospermopsis sp. LEGE 08334]|nr:hypothetical protein [Sphaerospermopsis sp. LEGE 08334]MBE9056723.1 hypothetical protein [Sphaerospermopsis sp. LEGE 08334]
MAFHSQSLNLSLSKSNILGMNIALPPYPKQRSHLQHPQKAIPLVS